MFVIIILAFLIIIGSVWWVGVWNIFLNLITTLLAGLIASSFYTNLAEQLNEVDDTYRYITEFVSIWLIFALAFLILRGLCEAISAYKMKLDIVTEMIGRSILSIWLACVFVSFASFTLHLAPIAPDSFQTDDDSINFAVGPDRFWMAFIQSRSRGALSESQDSALFPEYKLESHPDDVELDARVFDPKSQFIFDQMKKRKTISNNSGLRAN